MTQTLAQLVHVPYGNKHPYEQLPTERSPRDPRAGEAVTLGLATAPAGAAEEVWAEWRTEEQNGTQRVGGQWVRDDRDYSYWRIKLPAFDHGQRVSYTLASRQGAHHLKSEEFSFFVPLEYRAEHVARCARSSDHLEVVCTTEALSLQPRLRLTFPAEHVMHLALTATSPPDSATARESSSIVQHAEPAGEMYRVIEETDERLTIETARLRTTIHYRPFSLKVSTTDGTLLLQEREPFHLLVGEEGEILQVHHTFASPSDEAFYGFGERFNALNQRGNELDVRVFEQYKQQGRRTYIPIPFFVSSRGYGVFLDTNRYVTYDLAATQPDRWSFAAETGPQGELDMYVIGGQPSEVVTAFTELTAKPALPPRWVFGPWMSGNEWNSQAAVMEQVEKTKQYGIPATVLVIEAWSDESTFYIWNDADYTPKSAEEPFTYDDFTFPPDGRWPDPKGMIDELHRLGIRVLLWQIPVMKHLEEPHEQHDRDETYMIAQDYCVREADGRPYRVRPHWFDDGLVLDVTNADAVDWWLSKRAYLLDELEIDGFKTDGGEHLWGRYLRFADGRRGDELWNLYPNLYVGAYHRFAQEKRDGDAVTFSRAGYTGAQAFPCHWAGDENSTWEAFRASIVAGLNAGISGIPFWGWDLAGFSDEIPSAELYLRSAAMAAFCPIMQYHSEFNYHREPCQDRTPWNIAERTGNPDVIDVYRRFAQVRMRLLPYIEAEAEHCAKTGEPLMRPLFLDWPEDATAWDVTDQYCFGRALLVAPVVAPDVTERRLYLPAGEWEDVWDGTQVTGEQWITREVPLDIIPVYRHRVRSWPLSALKWTFT